MLDINSLCTDYDLADIRHRLARNAFAFGPDGCWVWVGLATNGDGYGRFGVIPPSGPQVKFHAHRVAWVAHRGPIPEGRKVLHTCDNRACVNPAHLFLGTQRDNMQDKVAKNRVGDTGRMLPERIARAILDDPRPNTQIAKAFDVTRSTVIAIKHRRTWAFL